MEKKVSFLNNLFMYFTIFIFFVISLLFLTKNNIILFLIAFSIVILISLKLKTKRFPLILFIVSFLIRIIAILILDFPQVSDAKTLLEASYSFANNDFSFQALPYFKMWGYQTGFVVYEGLILKIFNSVFVLKLLNAVFSSSLVLLIYYFGKKLVSEKSAKVASILYMIFPYSIYMNTIMINHHIAAFFTYVGILFLLRENKKIKDYAISAVLISLGNAMRPENIIVLFSLILFEMFRLKKNLVKETFKRLGIFILIYFLIGTTFSFAIQKTGINEVGLKNNNPLWKFVLGFNHDSCGYYDSDDEIYLNDEKKEMDIIKERILVSPVKMTRLMACKVNRLWLQTGLSAKNDMYLEKTFNIFGTQIKFTDVQNLVLGFNNILYIVTLFAFMLGVIFNKKKVGKSNSLFFLILIVVTFCVFLLIEIQPRYAYFIQVSIFILSTYGYDYLLDKVNEIIKKHKKKRLTN